MDLFQHHNPFHGRKDIPCAPSRKRLAFIPLTESAHAGPMEIFQGRGWKGQ